MQIYYDFFISAMISSPNMTRDSNELNHDIGLTWEYAVRNEKYLRKNDLQVLGLVEEERENLETKFIKFVEDNLQEEISADEIEIIDHFTVV